MKKLLFKTQSLSVYAVQIISLSLFVLYLGFMTKYYILFYDGTFEMFEYYKKLQVLNKEGFNLAIQFVILALVLLMFGLHKTRPGLFGLIAVLGSSVFMVMNSFSLVNIIPQYKRGYLALNFSELENYMPSTLSFDMGIALHYILIGVMIILSIAAIFTFSERLKDGNPIIRKLQ